MRIFVKVKPGSKKEKVEKIDSAHLLISLKALAEKGRANRGLIKAVADYFGIAPSRVRIASGRTSRQKIIEIT